MIRSRSVARFVIAFSVVGLLVTSNGCSVLGPKAIVAERYNVSDEILAATDASFERGKRRPIIDGLGWVIGIPSKIVLWNRKSENHNISEETEAILADYVQQNNLQHVKFRLNQYRPFDDWYRLTQNKSVGWGWRYTVGAVTVLGETILPGRVFGGDHYNPFTATVHLYSDIPVIALHEAAHAKDFSRRKYPGTYGAVYLIPGVPLWHESVASRDVFAYVEHLGDTKLQKQACHVLYPAYGTYAGNSLGYAVPGYSTPLYIGGVLTGHAVGRWKGKQIADPPNVTR